MSGSADWRRLVLLRARLWRCATATESLLLLQGAPVHNELLLLPRRSDARGVLGALRRDVATAPLHVLRTEWAMLGRRVNGHT